MIGNTYHACALEINQTGILVKGKSGSGKTSLMMGLLERAKQENLGAFLVADDQVYLKSIANNLEAKAPETIAGLVEIRGYGVMAHPNKKATNINLVIELVSDEKVERMPDQKFFNIHNLRLPLLEVPQRHEYQAVRIVFAWLIENADLHLA